MNKCQVKTTKIQFNEIIKTIQYIKIESNEDTEPLSKSQNEIELKLKHSRIQRKTLRGKLHQIEKRISSLEDKVKQLDHSGEGNINTL